jgi:hypothetical protein
MVRSKTAGDIQTIEKHAAFAHSQKNAIASEHANDSASSLIVTLTVRIVLDSRAAAAGTPSDVV